MHFNENYGRQQAKTKARAERIRIVYPKQKQGEFTPKIVPVEKTYSKAVLLSCFENVLSITFTEYAGELIKKTLEFCTNEHDKPTLPTPPSPLAAKYEHPDKETIPLFSRYKH